MNRPEVFSPTRTPTRSRRTLGKPTTPQIDEKKKKKKNVKEIDGVLWLLDERGKPLKKVRKKGDDLLSPMKSPMGMKKKKNIAEIDGQLFLLDDAGNPVKKIRKKGESKEQQSPARKPSRESDRPKSSSRLDSSKERPKSSRGLQVSPSTGRKPRTKKEYVDEKGRKVILEADGTKIVIGKNGKRLRPKKKSLSPTRKTSSKPKVPPIMASASAHQDFFNGMPGGSLFDELWDDTPSKGKSLADNVVEAEQAAVSLSAKIDEVGKENQELALKLESAEQEIENLVEQNKKEKAKSVKAVTQMMQVKVEYTEANSELQQLRNMVTGLKQQMTRKEKEMDDLNQLRKKALELERVQKLNLELQKQLEEQKKEKTVEGQDEKSSDSGDLESSEYESDEDDSDISVDFATGLPKNKKIEGEEASEPLASEDLSKHIGELNFFNNSMASFSGGMEAQQSKSSLGWWHLKGKY